MDDLISTKNKIIRILYISPHVDGYGADKSLLNNVLYLKEQNLIYPFFIVPREGLLTELLRENNIDFFVTNFKMWATGRKKNLFSFVKSIIKYLYNGLQIYNILFEIKTLNIQLIHTNDLITDIGIRCANKLKIPHIHHCRALLLELGITFDFSEKISLKYINKHSSIIICNSKTIIKRYSKYFSKDKVRLIHSAIYSKNKISKKIFDDNKNKIKFLFVGRIEPAKDPLTLVHAGNILKTMGYTNFEVHLYGGSNITFYNGYANQLNNYIINNNLVDLIFVHDFDKNIGARMQHFDVGIFCSPNEGIARVLIEFMINSLPVIGPNSGGTLDLIQDGLNGYLYKPKNIDELVKLMVKFLNDRSLIKKMGAYAYNSVSKTFSTEETSTMILQLYKDCLK